MCSQVKLVICVNEWPNAFTGASWMRQSYKIDLKRSVLVSWCVLINDVLEAICWWWVECFALQSFVNFIESTRQKKLYISEWNFNDLQCTAWCDMLYVGFIRLINRELNRKKTVALDMNSKIELKTCLNER